MLLGYWGEKMPKDGIFGISEEEHVSEWVQVCACCSHHGVSGEGKDAQAVLGAGPCVLQVAGEGTPACGTAAGMSCASASQKLNTEGTEP